MRARGEARKPRVPLPTPAPPRAASRTVRAACAPRLRRASRWSAGRPASVTVAIEPWLPWAPTLTLQSMPFSASGDSTLREHALRGVPAQLRLEHLADAGHRHRIDRDDLHRNGGALRRAFAHPRLPVRPARPSRPASAAHSRPAIRRHRRRAGRPRRQSRRRDAEHDLLDRRGIDIVAAADHEVLGAAGDPEIAVRIEPCRDRRS